MRGQYPGIVYDVIAWVVIVGMIAIMPPFMGYKWLSDRFRKSAFA